MNSSVRSGFHFEGPIDEQVCRRACAEFRRRLRAGKACQSEHVFAECPALAAEADFAVEIIYTEFVALEEAGRPVSMEEWYQRFPQYRERLERLFQVHAQLAAITPPEDKLAVPSLAPVKRVAGYEILEELGRGGMGVVYRARQPQLDRLVAIKMILAGAHADPAHHDRFLAEARAVARLHHPNIVQIFEVGDHDGCPFLALEYVPGGSLDKLQRGEPMPQRSAANLVEILARAIHHAHENGIIHRDLKPANVLLSVVAGDGWRVAGQDEGTKVAGKERAISIGAMSPPAMPTPQSPPATRHPPLATPKITDFGLAKDLADENGLTRTGAVLGTPSYMAPEQARGGSDEIGPATDVYALGAILYELLTGHPPFKGDSAIEILEQVRHQDPISVKRLQPKTAPDLETITHKCLSKEPWRRYASALALAEDLARFQADEPIRARPISSLEQVIRWCRRQPALAGMMLALVTVFVCGFAGVTWKWRDALIEGTAKEIALNDEIRERRSKELALQESSENLYFHQVALADREWAENNVGYAERLLENCPVELRQWEWYYLNGVCHSGRLNLRDPDGHRLYSHFRDDGECVAFSMRPDASRLWNITRNIDTGKAPSLIRWQGMLLCGPGGDRLALPGELGARPCFAFMTFFNRHPEIREANRGLLISQFPALPENEEPVTLSHTGKSLVTHSRKEGLVRIRALTGQETARLTVGEDIGQDTRVFELGWYKMVVFSPDDRLLAIAKQKNVQLWDVQQQKLVAKLTPKQGGLVSSLSFHPNGARLAAGSTMRTVAIWDLTTLEEVTTYSGHTDDVHTVNFSPDGKYVASGGRDRSVHIWNAETGSLYRCFRGHSRPVQDVEFGPRSEQLVSTDMENTVRLWDVDQLQECQLLRGHKRAIMALAFSPNGSQLISLGQDATIRAWDPRTGKALRSQKAPDAEPHAVVYRPDGQQYAVGGKSDVVTLYSPDGTETGRLAGHSDMISSLSYAPDSKRLASAAWDGTVNIWDLQSGQATLTIRHGAPWITSVAFSPDGKMVALAGTLGTVFLWDAMTGQSLGSVGSSRESVNAVAFHPDGKTLAAAYYDGKIMHWDLTTHSLVREFLGHSSGVFGLVFNRSGSRLFSSSLDQTIKVWDTPTGNPALTLKGHKFLILGLALSPDNRTLATGGIDEVIRLWRAELP
jgi:WD40 repeat protein/serine/threonine protein kinase